MLWGTKPRAGAFDRALQAFMVGGFVKVYKANVTAL
jgi:hypothetical protein